MHMGSTLPFSWEELWSGTHCASDWSGNKKERAYTTSRSLHQQHGRVIVLASRNGGLFALLGCWILSLDMDWLHVIPLCSLVSLGLHHDIWYVSIHKRGFPERDWAIPFFSGGGTVEWLVDRLAGLEGTPEICYTLRSAEPRLSCIAEGAGSDSGYSGSSVVTRVSQSIFRLLSAPTNFKSQSLFLLTDWFPEEKRLSF